VIEVTEQMGSRVAPVIKSLEELRRQGFRIALDDVGTGNAGLELLRKLDADFVKIDSSIVTAAPTDRKARAVLMAMATFSLQTGAFVIAEGIENDAILAFVRSLEEIDVRPGGLIHGGQGYKLGGPVSGTPQPFSEVPTDA
jgi:EAL domain-containing protein (putative c-di-GMP-specific phosphodiesterase class I)